MANIDLLRRVLHQIDTHPETWDQEDFAGGTFGCGTTHCVAGWALELSGIHYNAHDGWRRPATGGYGWVPVDPSSEARTLLEITHEQAWGPEDEIDGGLFSADATREDIQDIAEKLAAEEGVAL